jgi:hypothetical protein
MRARVRMAQALALPPASSWSTIEGYAAGMRGEWERAGRDLSEMKTFMTQVQLLAYEQGVAELLQDVEAAIATRSADLPIPILTHLRLLAEHWRDCSAA